MNGWSDGMMTGVILVLLLLGWMVFVSHTGGGVRKGKRGSRKGARRIRRSEKGRGHTSSLLRSTPPPSSSTLSKRALPGRRPSYKSGLRSSPRFYGTNDTNPLSFVTRESWSTGYNGDLKWVNDTTTTYPSSSWSVQVEMTNTTDEIQWASDFTFQRTSPTQYRLIPQKWVPPVTPHMTRTFELGGSGSVPRQWTLITTDSPVPPPPPPPPPPLPDTDWQIGVETATCEGTYSLPVRVTSQHGTPTDVWQLRLTAVPSFGGGGATLPTSSGFTIVRVPTPQNTLSETILATPIEKKAWTRGESRTFLFHGTGCTPRSVTVEVKSDSAPPPPPPPPPDPKPKPDPKPTPDTDDIKWPERVFAPYIDMSAWPHPEVVKDYVKATGHKWYTFAFIVANDTGDGSPAWGGYNDYSVEKKYFLDMFMQLRRVGGDATISFGGAAKQELALVHSSDQTLYEAYDVVLRTYAPVVSVDLDIEGKALENHESVQRRNRVWARLTKAYPTLRLSYTLPVIPAGLTSDGIYLLNDAVAKGVRLHEVRIMTMDYDVWAAPPGEHTLGEYAIQATVSTWRQLQNEVKGLPDTVGVSVCPMIGINDIHTEVFRQTDARELLAFAESPSPSSIRVTSLAMWSVNRDRQGTVGTFDTYASGVPQNPFDFTRIFSTFGQNRAPMRRRFKR